jgi:hypothetical protein
MFNTFVGFCQVKKQFQDVFFLCILAYLGRLLIFGASFGDAVVFCSLTSLWAFKEFLASKKTPDLSEEVKKELAIMRDALSAMKMTNSFVKPKPFVENERPNAARIF